MIQAWPPRAGRAAHQMPVRGSGSRRSTAGPTRRQAAGDRPGRQARLPVSQSNPLTCPAFPATLADKAALRASVASCLAHLHGDLRFYTTAMFTDDASQILTDLHYTTVNLIGGSYGPTAEQVFLLRHPGQVRTMTLMNGTLLIPGCRLFEISACGPPGNRGRSHRTTRSRPGLPARLQATASWTWQPRTR
jgi:pimeloyl-ACP methyl ester carboxylesterase